MSEKNILLYATYTLLILTSVTLLIWYVWAIEYRNNPTVISDKILTKTSTTTPDENNFNIIENPIHNVQTNVVYATRTTRNKLNGEIVKSEQVILQVSPTCNLSDNNCIKL